MSPEAREAPAPGVLQPLTRMSHDDSAFLHIEDGVHHMHLASVAVFEGPAPQFTDLRDLVERLLPEVPRYRRRVRTVPLDLQRPVWVDDPFFNVDYHLRHTALPGPGSREQLRNLVGRVMSQQLDRAKPLWELWEVEDLEDGRWALISKVHHALVDAVGGRDLLTLLLDAPTVPTGEPLPWRPPPEPSPLRLAAGAAGELVTSPVEAYRAARSLGRRAHRASIGAVRAVRQLSALAPPERGAGSLTGPIGPHRRWHELRLPLEDALACTDPEGTSVNDVVLAAVAHGFRGLLLDRGEPVERRFVSTFVPLSIHGTDLAAGDDAAVSSTFIDLPVGPERPGDVLEVIRRQRRSLVRSQSSVSGELLTPVSGFAAPMLLSMGMRSATRAVGDLPEVHTIAAAVPGPRDQLGLLGRPMIEVYPYVPLREEMRLALAVYAYDDQLGFGITGDYDTTADIDVLADGIAAGFAQLVAASAVSATA